MLNARSFKNPALFVSYTFLRSVFLHDAVVHNRISRRMSTDFSKLTVALEYVDMAAGLYLAGDSNHAARLLAAAAEEVLSDLARLLGMHMHADEMQVLLARIAQRYQSPAIEAQSQTRLRNVQLQAPSVAGNLNELADLPPDMLPDNVRMTTATYLRAAWYTLQSMGLDAVIPMRLQQAVAQSTICTPAEADEASN